MSYPNPEQQAVLSHLNGTLLVLAPAGTGKTRLMADRLSKVISSGMPPEHTLGVTFTNRAAEHMRTAVKDACGADAKACRIQTFHGLCAWILRTEARDVGLPSDFVIYDEQDSIDLLRQCIKESGISPDAAFWQLSQIKSDCPVTELMLRHNYRATKSLLRVASRHASTFKIRRTYLEPAPTLPEGIAPECHTAQHSGAEASWIASRIRRMLAEGNAGRIGILTRTHKRSEAVSNALTQSEIPHLTVEEFDFFRRQEIKDLLARLRLLLNPSDSGSLQRITQRPSSGIGSATLRTLWTDGQHCGLKITDLAQIQSHVHGDPFHTLLDALAHGTVVVFDVETTGLSPTADEVIDLGAVKLQAGRVVAEFDALLRPSRRLGESAAVHGISEETLFKEGRDPAEVFREFAKFSDGAVLVGHNVGFDLSMIRAHAARLGVPIHTAIWDDTLDLARRLLSLERYDLGTVSSHLETRSIPSHRALADARPTAEILLELGIRMEAGTAFRKELVTRHGPLFLPIARQLESWRELSATLRPAALCQRILIESGLLDHYLDDPSRIANLDRFVQFFHDQDDLARPPADMLADLTRTVALSRNLDFLALNDSSIPILTVHQSKGLEFDTVFIAGMTEDEFPSYYAKRDLKLEEEKRLFYVAITRAKRHLVLTSHLNNDWNRAKPASSFLAGLR